MSLTETNWCISQAEHTLSIQMDTEEVDIGSFDSLESRARLQSSERYTIIMEVSPSWPDMACTSALPLSPFFGPS